MGDFKCPDKTYLAYWNKTKLNSTKTECLAAAQWKDVDVVRCWTGEHLKLKAIFILFVGGVSVCYFFAGCSIGSSRSLEVISQSSDLGAIGRFICRNNGTLFYSNKTKVVSTKTKCLDSFYWENADIVQCWTGIVLCVELAETYKTV